MVLIAYRPKHMPLLLGVSRSTYYLIVKKGEIAWTRLYPGGPRVHLPSHIKDYEERMRAREQRTRQAS